MSPAAEWLAPSRVRVRQTRMSDQVCNTPIRNVLTPEAARQIDDDLRSHIEMLLNEAGVFHLSTFGWVDAYNADPEFIGHAMWQTDPPVSHDHVVFNARRKWTGNPPAEPTKEQALLAVSGADFEGLMTAARMSIGLFLFQANFLREFLFHDDKFFDLHGISSIIYLATASERVREYFIAAAFGKKQKSYEDGELKSDEFSAWLRKQKQGLLRENIKAKKGAGTQRRFSKPRTP